jgi:hypothetical protein
VVQDKQTTMPVQSTCSSRNSIRYPLAGRVAARGVQTQGLLFARKGVHSKVRFPPLPKCQLNIQSPSDASTERLNPVASGFSTPVVWNCRTDKSTADRFQNNRDQRGSVGNVDQPVNWRQRLNEDISPSEFGGERGETLFFPLYSFQLGGWHASYK